MLGRVLPAGCGGGGRCWGSGGGCLPAGVKCVHTNAWCGRSVSQQRNVGVGGPASEPPAPSACPPPRAPWVLIANHSQHRWPHPVPWQSRAVPGCPGEQLGAPWPVGLVCAWLTFEEPAAFALPGGIFLLFPHPLLPGCRAAGTCWCLISAGIQAFVSVKRRGPGFQSHRQMSAGRGLHTCQAASFLSQSQGLWGTGAFGKCVVCPEVSTFSEDRLSHLRVKNQAARVS